MDLGSNLEEAIFGISNKSYFGELSKVVNEYTQEASKIIFHDIQI